MMGYDDGFHGFIMMGLMGWIWVGLWWVMTREILWKSRIATNFAEFDS